MKDELEYWKQRARLVEQRNNSLIAEIHRLRGRKALIENEEGEETQTMDCQQLANMLNAKQVESAREIAKEIQLANESNLVIVFIDSYNSEVVQFHGAIKEERISTVEGDVFVDAYGVVPDLAWGGEYNYSNEYLADYYSRRAKAIRIRCKEHKDGAEYMRTVTTKTPHATFDIFDEEDKFSKGIVLSVNDAILPPSP